MRSEAEQRRIEQTVFWVSLLVIVSLVAGLVWLDRPLQPEGLQVVAKVTALDRAEDALIVGYEVSNRGTKAVEEVVVRIAVPRGSEQVEQVIAHMPVGASRKGVATLYDVPADARPEARVLGYQLP